MKKAMLTSIMLISMFSFQSCSNGDFEKVINVIEDRTQELPTIPDSLPVVPQKAFYKDIFLDAGVGLTSRKSLHAARYLNLTTEGISFSRSNASDEEVSLQNDIIGGDENDINGRLLYPDGQPRYRLLIVNGGNAVMHGESLYNNSLYRMKQFVQNGGSYVGICAGAFIGSKGYIDNIDYPYYLSLWPSMINRTKISNITTGMFIEHDSPLLSYYNFGGDYYVSNVRHNRGCYPSGWTEGTIVLARYDYPSRADIHEQPCIWAYKSSLLSGRVVLSGSHPEGVSSGERRDLTASMMLYSLDGVGLTTIKGFLENGKVRMMDKSTEDDDPLFTMIGDLQCHHFAVKIPPNARNITMSVNSEVDCNLSLTMCHDTYAYPEDAEYVSVAKGSFQELSFPTLEAGVWFISVKCLTTVEVKETDYGQTYIDKAGVLNGIPYQIVVSWDITTVEN